jgi:tetratricopeptide (TPR) repeat protein
MGVYDKAESYLNSAWQALQNGAVGDYLGQLYEKERKLPMALRTYTLALEAYPWLEDTPARMRNLANVPLPKNRISAGEELSLMRTIRLPVITKENVNAYFDVLIAGGKIEKAHFVSRSDLLNDAGDNLEKSTFEEAFPPNSTAHVFRRGVLPCSEIGCSFVFYPLSVTARTN